MPTSDYKTITVRTSTFFKFGERLRKVRKKDASMTNSLYLEYLLDLDKIA